MVAAKASDGRQVRWDKHNQARRQVILDAAIAVAEAAEPGAEFHLQQIAKQAGLNRSVVYRHFADRADLDHAIQRRIIEDITARLLPCITLDGTVPEVITRIITTYVEWAEAHPSLHHLAERETASGSAPLEQGIDLIATVIVEVLETATDTLDFRLGDDERALVDPFAYGLVGQVYGTVRRWLSRSPRRPAAAQLTSLLSTSIWSLLDGHARRLGVEIDPDVPLEQMLSSVEAEADGDD